MPPKKRRRAAASSSGAEQNTDAAALQQQQLGEERERAAEEERALLLSEAQAAAAKIVGVLSDEFDYTSRGCKFKSRCLDVLLSYFHAATLAMSFARFQTRPEEFVHDVLCLFTSPTLHQHTLRQRPVGQVMLHRLCVNL
jgi:hypothetical protein